MVQKSVKLLFRDFQELIMTLVDKVHGVTPYSQQLSGNMPPQSAREVSEEEQMIITMEEELYRKVSDHQRPNGKQLVLIIDMVSQLIKGGGATDQINIPSIGQKVCEVFLETSSNEQVWQNFESETLQGVIESYKSFCE